MLALHALPAWIHRVADHVAVLRKHDGVCHIPTNGTVVHALVRVDEYKGLRKGRNGTHEVFEGTITQLVSAGKPELVDTHNVEVAMNVQSKRDPDGLPEGGVPLRLGQVVELQGILIPSTASKARNANGPAAELHFTHAPCGSVTIDGKTYSGVPDDGMLDPPRAASTSR
jgi:hypothetical protein